MNSIDSIWSTSDYEPTSVKLEPVATQVANIAAKHLQPGSRVIDMGAGHGTTTRALLAHAFSVTAIEPAERIRTIGQARTPQATWLNTLGEDTGLPSRSHNGIASSFGSMFCDASSGPIEWARILKPSGLLVMSAWSETGFLGEMTRIMTEILQPGGDMPPHMQWLREQVAADRLGSEFEILSITEHALPWCFSSVAEGMTYYLEGSPVHAWTFNHIGSQRDDLYAALENQLRALTANDGSISTYAHYGIIVAKRR